jgi:hypothetical protein
MRNIWGRKRKDPYALQKKARLTTANEFINVQDVKGEILYGKDGHIFAFLKIQPISLELLSPREKEAKIRSFAAEFSAEKKGYKFFSISRPVDISRLVSRLSGLLADAADPKLKELLNAEATEIVSFAMTGEVTERQFYLVAWDAAGREKDLVKRAHELAGRFDSCEIKTELCGRGAIIQLLNLFSNPNYAHLEDSDVAESIPALSDGGARAI